MIWRWNVGCRFTKQKEISSQIVLNCSSGLAGFVFDLSQDNYRDQSCCKSKSALCLSLTSFLRYLLCIEIEKLKQKHEIQWRYDDPAITKLGLKLSIIIQLATTVREREDYQGLFHISSLQTLLISCLVKYKLRLTQNYLEFNQNQEVFEFTLLIL